MLGGLKRLFGGGNGDGVEALERALLAIAREVWQVEEQARDNHYPAFEFLAARDPEQRDQLVALREQRVAQRFQALQARWPEAELTRLATEMYFNSQPWHDRYVWDHRRPEATRWLLPAQGRIIHYLLQTWLAAHPSPELVARLRWRLEHLFAKPREAPEVPAGSTYPYPPVMRHCLDLLRAQQGEAATALAFDLLRGAYFRSSQERLADRYDVTRTSYQPHLQELDRAAPYLLERVWRAGLLDEELLLGVFRRQPTLLARATGVPTPKFGRNYLFHEMAPELATLIAGHANGLARRWAEDLDESNAFLLSTVEHLQGSWFLLKACEYVERLGLKKLPPNDYSHRGELAAAVSRLCHLARVAEDEPAVVEALRCFQEKTLLLVLPAAPQYQDLICRALNWEGAQELLLLIQRVAHFDESESNYERDVRNSADPTNGVLDPHRVRALQAQLGEKRYRALLTTLSAYPTNTKNVLYLLEACLGNNRGKVVEGFGKRNQLAVRGLGLLPLEHPDELPRRYVALRQFAREASKFGVQRQTNERAAALAGLANLALNGGYADVTRLEWAMEDRLGAELGAGGREWQIEPTCVVRLEVGAGGPDLTAYREGKPLKSLPEVVKKHPEYAVMKEAKAELRAQVRRYRLALEDVMCRGEQLALSEVETLARHPAAARMLSALLVSDGQGRVGLCQAADLQLEEADGRRRPLEGPLRVAHPVELPASGQLAVWQREVVRRRLVQPFKQAFREIYVVTPAEAETRVFSRRYAGQAVESARAGRLLTAEGWECAGEEFPRKLFPGAGLSAELSFVESYHYMGEIETLVVDEVCFLPAGARWWNPQHDLRLPLAEVPPRIFSEVMRDVDLVVSVAQSMGVTVAEAVAGVGLGCRLPALPSAEVVERRGDLVRELAADLGFKNVSVEGQFARVRGRLATYRVHLASATIHIEPGAYLCVVPDRWGQRHDKIFLPFDAEDQKTSEVISKVLLLAEDDKIKDESILSQIRSRAGG
ncbi:MAG: DUF4132 domain-containing protein [Chloroflexota bacterium]